MGPAWWAESCNSAPHSEHPAESKSEPPPGAPALAPSSLPPWRGLSCVYTHRQVQGGEVTGWRSCSCLVEELGPRSPSLSHAAAFVFHLPPARPPMAEHGDFKHFPHPPTSLRDTLPACPPVCLPDRTAQPQAPVPHSEDSPKSCHRNKTPREES